MSKTTLIGLLACCLAAGCSVALYVPASPDPQLQAQLTEGRKLYVDRCSGCHNLYAPKKYNPEKWQSELNKMQKRAKISDAQKNLIHLYLVSEPPPELKKRK